MIFLSHSSIDKPLIDEIAFELINEGIDVWLDKWEIENGDLLDKKISEGIDESSFVILFISPNSLKSDWVKRELEKTLSRENEEGRKYLLLVKLMECDLDEGLSSRLYTDFSGSFTEGLANLVRLLKAKKQHIGLPEHPLIPIKIEHLLYVDKESLERLFSRIKNVVKANGIESGQILIVQHEEYQVFKRQAYHAFDAFKNSGNNKEHISYYRDVLREIEDLEDTLVSGIAQILGQGNMHSYFDLIESVSWFYRSVFFTIGAKIDQLTNNKVSEYTGVKLLLSPFGSDQSVAQFYDVKAVRSFDVWEEKDQMKYVKFWASADSGLASNFEEFPFIQRFWDVCDPTDCFKYLVPQMVRRGLASTNPTIIWDFSKVMIGPA